VGCKFSNLWVRVFNLHFPETMKSCRHKSYRHPILNWFRTGGGDLIGLRRGIQRQGETDRQKSLWTENAARHRNRDVSPDGVHPPRDENIPQILLRSLLQRAASEGSFSQWEKGHQNCTSRASRLWINSLPTPHEGAGKRLRIALAAAPATRLLPPPKLMLHHIQTCSRTPEQPEKSAVPPPPTDISAGDGYK